MTDTCLKRIRMEYLSSLDPDGIFVQLGSGWNICQAQIQMKYLSIARIQIDYLYSLDPEGIFVQLGYG